MRFQRAERPAVLNGYAAAHRFFSLYFCGPESARERLWVAHVDSTNRCLHVGCYDGEDDFVELPVRQIIKDALHCGSSGVVLAHNHPGGDPTPSQADCHATRKLARAAESLDLSVLDHLVFAGSTCSSMRRMGLL